MNQVFYYIFEEVLFIIKVQIVEEEIEKGWKKKRGVLRWVGEELGKRWGFIEILIVWVE